ncbi:trypsin beta-like [Pectinophora gossypiella]|uniref:trypsin beta-like n=1 Tax=Pectinophora gossypiella TaxID=13191 RepID=UPI00214EE9F3|nr:trypsin beta-like [Pectinophora gossypiella]
MSSHLPNYKGGQEKKLALKILGGDPTSLKNFPFNVFFLNYAGVCSGVILTSKLVLTAAHCLDVNYNILEMRIYANSRYFFDHKADVHEVSRFIIHVRYNIPVKFSNDLAMLIISDQFRFKPTVKKAWIATHERWMRENETRFYVSGWGEIDNVGTDNKRGLLNAFMTYVPQYKCEELTDIRLSREMFCLWGNGKRDTCRGDSGGGVLWNGMVVGIVSFGGVCGGHPGVYVNLYRAREWMNEAARYLIQEFCKVNDKIKLKC